MPYWLLEEIDPEGLVPPALSSGEFAKDEKAPEGAEEFTVKRTFERAVAKSEKTASKAIDAQIKAEEADDAKLEKAVEKTNNGRALGRG